MQSVPDQIIIACKEMGYGEMNIRKCWDLAKGDQVKFETYLWEGYVEPPVQKDDNLNVNITNYLKKNGLLQTNYFQQIQKDSLQEHKLYQRTSRLRGKDQYVGLANIGNTCSINSILQYCHQIPQLFKLSIECQNGEKDMYHKFILNMQSLFLQLIASNLEYVNPQQALNTMCWDAQEQQYIGVQQDIVEIFNLILNKFDKSIRRLHLQNLMATNVQRVELFGNQQMNELFQIVFMNDNNQKEYHPNLVATLNHKNIRTFLLKEFANKILELPKFLRISVNRINFRNRAIVKSNDEFIIDNLLNLEICMYNNNNANKKEQISILQNQINELQKDIQKFRQQHSCLVGVLKIYEDEGIFWDLIVYLKKKIDGLLSQIKIKEEQYKQQSSIINQQQSSSKFQYRIHSIVVHFGSAWEGHNYIYIYNFFLEKWMKYNDISVNLVSEHQVQNDSKTYGQLVTYVDQEMIPQLKAHYQFIQNVGNTVVQQPNRDLTKMAELSYIPQNILASVTEKNRQNLGNQCR
ncbi:unnamed protein product (macronuclear) [Paramecium tetraurelia]|uniref:ubiquitinyl hydrolase 1 n=1 Tax=Paramecium tetraurelia TaxID=5888 RepID=A0EAI6_PARTE|nr:uncharacterized protein GSPATT00025036001 [Paramecium tetraurelia]CAK92303.1 unnamed protein product [Paramecium tetraurelia]|eukprot:XP_001459700.1 hypothetical protein (macronuclear) [Paramecium tetraurelia strain d4-2]